MPCGCGASTTRHLKVCMKCMKISMSSKNSTPPLRKDTWMQTHRWLQFWSLVWWNWLNNQHLIPLKWTLNPVDDLKHDYVMYQQIPVAYRLHRPQTSCIGQVVKQGCCWLVKVIKGCTFRYLTSQEQQNGLLCSPLISHLIIKNPDTRGLHNYIMLKCPV